MNVELQQQIIQHYKNGYSVKKLSEVFFYCVQTIYKVLKNNNIILESRPNIKLTLREKNKIIFMYQSGESMENIQIDSGYGYKIVRRCLIISGVPIRKKGGSLEKPIPIRKHLEEILKKHSKKDVAKHYDISIITLNKWIKARHLSFKRKHMADEEFIKRYYEYYYNSENNLFVFSMIIDFSYEYIRRKQIKLNLPRKDKRSTFRKQNKIDIQKIGVISHE